MDHLAILAKERKLLAKIKTGEKTIESRWYKFRRTPYHHISKDDTIYFKDSGEPVTIKAEVAQVLFFADLDENKIKEIIQEYGERICLSPSYVPKLIGKKYCILIFLKDVKSLLPFHINKKGYGIMSAWITLKDINSLKALPS